MHLRSLVSRRQSRTQPRPIRHQSRFSFDVDSTRQERVVRSILCALSVPELASPDDRARKPAGENPMKQTLLIISFLSAVVCTTLGQDVARKTAQAGNTKPSADLYNEIAHMDSVLFDAFNTQNLDKMKQLFTDDLEFFHDNDGLIRYS